MLFRVASIGKYEAGILVGFQFGRLADGFQQLSANGGLVLSDDFGVVHSSVKGAEVVISLCRGVEHNAICARKIVHRRGTILFRVGLCFSLGTLLDAFMARGEGKDTQKGQ